MEELLVEQSRQLKESRDRIRQFISQFRSFESTLGGEICLIGAHERKRLECLDKRWVNGQYKIPVLFVGPNSSGKSSLINVSAGFDLLPTGEGYVTGRICRLTDSENDGKAWIDVGGTIVERFDWPSGEITYEWIMGYNDMIEKHLTRPKNSCDMSEWCSQLVTIHCPLPLLKNGFDLYDGPGTSSTDTKEVQDALAKFVQQVNPIIVFVIGNPSISDGEVNCFQMLKDANTSLMCRSDNRSRIFFASNKADYDQLLVMGKNSRNQLANQSKRECYMNLSLKLKAQRKQLLIKSNIGRIFNFSDDIDCFECVSSRDLQLLDSSEINERDQVVLSMAKAFTDSLINFIKRTETFEFLDAVEIISRGLSQFIHCVEADGNERISFSNQVNQSRESSTKFSECLCSFFKVKTSSITQTLKQELGRYREGVDDLVKTDRFKPFAGSYLTPSNFTKVKDVIIQDIRENVIKPAISRLSISDDILKLGARFTDNPVFVDIMRTVLGKNGMKVYISILEETIENLLVKMITESVHKIAFSTILNVLSSWIKGEILKIIDIVDHINPHDLELAMVSVITSIGQELFDESNRRESLIKKLAHFPNKDALLQAKQLLQNVNK